MDDKSVKHKGEFQRLNFSALRQQFIRSMTTLVLNSESQWAFTNLDSSQKFSLGGPRSVRAYESGTLSGDSGLFVSAELRELLPAPPPSLNLRGQWFASVFVEAARTKINRRPWDTASNEESLSGAGLGLNWLGPDNWRASLSWARPIEPVPAAYAGSKRGNVWFELAKGFR
ncbi:MAG: ShlB/FhaC/HecB family hemolysin secretion/activation protein [Limnohabitans sp.]|nr:ShlB/FhaC/HecB family hemolysin secretion/activation protein [Limnohabitans sp.]